MKITYKNTDELSSDMLTKNLAADKFIKFRDEVMGGRGLQEFFLSHSQDNF
jgi:hypothetical protein